MPSDRRLDPEASYLRGATEPGQRLSGSLVPPRHRSPRIRAGRIHRRQLPLPFEPARPVIPRASGIDHSTRPATRAESRSPHASGKEPARKGRRERAGEKEQVAKMFRLNGAREWRHQNLRSGSFERHSPKADGEANRNDTRPARLRATACSRPTGSRPTGDGRWPTQACRLTVGDLRPPLIRLATGDALADFRLHCGADLLLHCVQFIPQRFQLVTERLQFRRALLEEIRNHFRVLLQVVAILLQQ